MFRKTFTGTLVAASLTAGALLTLPTATAAPTFVKGVNVSGTAELPQDAVVAMAENGASVAAWVRNGRIQASSAKAGVWTSADYVSAPGETVDDPAVAMNDKGEAVVAWTQTDASDDVRIAASRMDAAGAFGTGSLIGADSGLDIEDGLDVALDGSGTLFAAHRITNNGAFNQVRVTRWTKAGVSATDAVSDTSAFGGDVAVNTQGQALVAFNDALNGTEVVNARRWNPATKTWSAVDSVGLVGQYGNEVETALGDDGFGTVAYVKQYVDNHFRAQVNVSRPDATLGGASFASAEGFDAAYLSLAQNDKGAALLSYDRVGNGNYIGFAQRSEAGTWTSPAIVNEALDTVSQPVSAISDSGFALIGYDDAGHQRAAYRAQIFQGMTKYDSGAAKFEYAETGVGVDVQGNAVLTGVIHGNDPTQGFVTGKILDTAGPISVATLGSSTTVGSKILVKRVAVDRFSNPGTGDVRVRSAAFNSSTFSGYTTVVSNTPAYSLIYNAVPGRTFCFSVRARDQHQNIGAWSTEKCSTTVTDDRELVRTGGFQRATNAAAFRGTVTQATKKNAVLVVQNVKARRIGVLVSKRANGGKVTVSFGGQKIGTYSLKGSGNLVWVASKDLGAVKTGTLSIRVVSKSGKPVVIDGFLAAK